MSGEIEVSLLKSAMILDAFQVIVAANKAQHLQNRGTMITKNIHSEILYRLSPSKKISESFSCFGAADSDTSLVVAIDDDTDNSRLERVSQVLQASSVCLSELSKSSNDELI